MTPPGGGGVRPPISGADIVKEMFEGDKQKPLNDAQRSSQLQEQSRTQETVRRGTGEAREEQTEEARRDKAEGQNRTQQRAKTQGRTSTRTRTEKQMDGFLNRSSTQQKTREAGRELNQDRRLRTHTPQSWTVGTSRQASPKAKRFIMARQQANRGNQPKTQTRPQGTPRTPQNYQPSTTARSTPLPQLNIRYGPPATPRNTQQARPQTRLPFAGRFDATRVLSQQITRMVVARQASSARNQAQPNQPAVLVHLRGRLVFVRDGGKTRAFKFNKDGSLSELPTEDASDQPLSNEAKAQLRKVLRQRGIRAHVGGERISNPRRNIGG